MLSELHFKVPDNVSAGMSHAPAASQKPGQQDVPGVRVCGDGKEAVDKEAEEYLFSLRFQDSILPVQTSVHNCPVAAAHQVAVGHVNEGPSLGSRHSNTLQLKTTRRSECSAGLAVYKLSMSTTF